MTSTILSALRSKPLVLGYMGARSGLYFVEALPMILVQNLLRRRSGAGATPPLAFREASLQHVLRLLERDADNIAHGYYPPAVLAPADDPLSHSRRLLAILWDAVGVSWRRRTRTTKRFRGVDPETLKDLPEYYRRNFHYQTDGYLSEQSAELYDHQVELLFRGATGPMRRLALRPLKERLPGAGEGLKFVELGAGTGSVTRDMALTFPEAELLGLDLSQPYLQKARRRLKTAPNVDFRIGNAEDTGLEASSRDVVYSVFLFHELPRDVRERVLAETLRILKPGGLCVIVDSLQRDDVPDLNWALEKFPVDFHEPFYRNYIETPLEELLTRSGFAVEFCETGFLSKVLLARKPG